MFRIGRAAREICYNQSEAIPKSEIVTRHQYGISAPVFQTSFRTEPAVASWNVGCFLSLKMVQNYK